ncbi:hypothetical protein C5S53_04410 [Methanophagales archaeon]|nr:hypothetical protein C5S53_04410 [Methanophagales archaeon]
MTVKSVAAKEGKKLEKHGGLWRFVENRSCDRKDDDLLALFHIGNNLYSREIHTMGTFLGTIQLVKFKDVLEIHPTKLLLDSLCF